MTKTRAIALGVSLMPSEDFRVASSPLFERGAVQAVEWNIDMELDGSVPSWISTLLDEFERRDSLFAHSVELSPLTATLASHQRIHLDHLERSLAARRYRHLTEHLGFMMAGDFTRGTPLPLPPSRAALALAKDRLRELGERARTPVGLENLALAMGRDDALAQADFMSEALEAANAFLLLDAHNLVCQAENFGIEMEDLASRYPLTRVREIHVAGGRVLVPRTDETRTFRRDSHDHDLPEAVFRLLTWLLPRCPSLEVVILERSDRTLFGIDEISRYHEDFERLDSILTKSASLPTSPSAGQDRARRPLLEDDSVALDAFQRAVLELYSANDGEPTTVRAELVCDTRLRSYESWIDRWEPFAVETARDLVRQWSIRSKGEDEELACVLRAPNLPFEVTHRRPSEPGFGQVRIRTLASGLCGTDVHIWQGRYPLPLPSVLGHEPVGIVDAIGEGVTRLHIGDRVGVRWTQRGCGSCSECARRASFCQDPITWIQNGGGHAESFLAEASGCFLIPSELASELAAPLFCAGFTVMSGFAAARLRPRERVAVVGLGGLGHLAVQLAKVFDHPLLVVTSSAAKVSDALALGADHAIAVSRDAHVGAEIRAEGGADVIFATTSSMQHASDSAAGLLPEGRLVVLGIGDGTLRIDPMDLILRQASVIGAMPDRPEDLVALLALAAAGRIVPQVECYPPTMLERAMVRLAEGRVRHRAVLTFA